MFTILKQRRMRSLGHDVRMEDGHILKELMYDELLHGTQQ